MNHSIKLRFPKYLSCDMRSFRFFPRTFVLKLVLGLGKFFSSVGRTRIFFEIKIKKRKEKIVSCLTTLSEFFAAVCGVFLLFRTK